MSSLNHQPPEMSNTKFGCNDTRVDRIDSISFGNERRVLLAVMPNGTHISVKIKLEHDEHPQRSSSSNDETGPWICPICDRTNHPSKKRCSSCQSWRRGLRKIVAETDAPLDEVAHAMKSLKKGSYTSEWMEEDKRVDADVSMAERLPKRKRTNLYSSLSPAAIEATAKARREAFALAPPPPQRLSRPNKKSQSNNNDKKNENAPTPASVAASAAEAAGKDIKQFIGQDGNLFYCFICLGVGEVVCCDGCPHVFHPACLPPGPSKTSLENDDDPWYCHDCVANGKAPKSGASTKKRKRVKERCSECGRKETKSHPCIPCSGGDCNHFIHSVCPRIGDDKSNEHYSRRSHCTTCKTNGSYFNQVLSPRAGRGSVSGRGGNVLLRMSSSEERKRRSTIESEEQIVFPIHGKNRVYSSGFQAPYVESDDEEDDEVGTESLAYVEKPLSSIPGFFFFLLYNRSTIEKSMSRKNPSFRKLARGTARNEKIAEAGAALWIDLSHNERKKWIEMSMKDFEQRVVAWKQQEVIQAMIKSMDEQERDSQGELCPKNTSHLLPENSTPIAGPVNSQLPRVGENKIRNRILIELLHDARYHPLPLVDAIKPDKDEGQRRDHVNSGVKMTVQQFETQGPIATSLGDDCMGCTRGWNHFCSVLKRPLSGSRHRAKLQPPVTSLTATRIGFGLMVNLPREFHQLQQQAEKAAVGFGVSEVCPNFQPRDDFYLLSPSLRLDDTTEFIEKIMAMKQMQTKVSLSQEVKHQIETQRGSTPLRERKETLSGENREPSASSTSRGECDTARQRHKCGTCGFSLSNSSSSGCSNCQKSQLIRQMAKRRVLSQHSTADDSLRDSTDGFVKPTCSMLGRSNRNETSSSHNIHRDGMNSVGLFLTKETWTPNVILPPNPKPFPTPKPRIDDARRSQEEKYRKQFNPGNLESVDGVPRNCSNCTHRNIASTTSCVSCKWRKGGHGENIDSNRPRNRTPKGGLGEISQDRNALALKHKYDANELSRKCLTIACSGLLAGIIRRDPLRLFAEPVPADVEEYYHVIKDPIDCSALRQLILASKYTSLGSFISDARRLCINACVFNAADSLYAKTAQKIFDSIQIMHDRAKKWTTIIKNAHASSFIANEDGKCKGEIDVFKDVKLAWPGAIELLEVDGEWLKKVAASDFTRTSENEIAYYGSLAVKRATSAAKASLESYPDVSGAKQLVIKRSHVQDEALRKQVNAAAALHVGPIELCDEPDWREFQLLKLLKRIRKHRVDRLMTSESCCARCDGFKTDETSKVVTMLRSDFKRTIESTRPRIAASRMACFNSRELNAVQSTIACTPLEAIDRIATDSMVSVRGSRIHGWGLYADHPFQEGDIVAEYIGEYVSDAVADLRERRYREQRIQDYQFRIDGSLVIDATLRGGHARYINHSCSPNCTAKIVKGQSPNEHLKRVFIVCQRDINASEELSYDYNFPLEMNLDLRIPCNCGSKQCRGFMNWDIPEKSNICSTRVSRSGAIPYLAYNHPLQYEKGLHMGITTGFCGSLTHYRHGIRKW